MICQAILHNELVGHPHAVGLHRMFDTIVGTANFSCRCKSQKLAYFFPLFERCGDCHHYWVGLVRDCGLLANRSSGLCVLFTVVEVGNLPLASHQLLGLSCEQYEGRPHSSWIAGWGFRKVVFTTVPCAAAADCAQPTLDGLCIMCLENHAVRRQSMS